ncbi:protein kinase domain protein [Halomicronema hongdechloris C2206]|uniref:Protein kinase domain protein n=1 Tax=Halomicronema hongdechloris C2206 TaxID=1641165 RepID=A0A1Z3HGZ0_9CYAN|nr:protein kinase [Halomicronema hongdechloris]ASC69467.1 protein kinase domain protein [Halomicronema hongdechloris C2206]
MSFCINPQCSKPQNSRQPLFCESCGSDLLLDGRYRVIERLGRGGFADTYEVFEFGTPKILKVLHHKEPKALELFKREFDVLSRLNHPGIPKVDPDAYFTFMPKGSLEVLHCFVMEKIEGMDLEKYMEKRGNQPISEKTGLAWLEQIVEILQVIHEQDFLHRDIKPSNIILKPDGQLALIDFGAVREMSQTYMQKSKITAISSAGYTPPEQVNGKAIIQSDFFALGRTFVFLFTGKEPGAFNLDPRTAELVWQDDAKQISERVIGIIDLMMAYIPDNRPALASDVLQEIESPKISQKIETPHSKNIQKQAFWRRFPAAVIDYAAIAILGVIPYSILYEVLDRINPYPSFPYGLFSDEVDPIEEQLHNQQVDLHWQLDNIFQWISLVSTYLIVGAVYHALTESSTRQASPGKRLFKVHLRNEIGNHLGFMKALARAILKQIFWLLFVLYPIASATYVYGSLYWFSLAAFLFVVISLLITLRNKNFLYDLASRTKVLIK